MQVQKDGFSAVFWSLWLKMFFSVRGAVSSTALGPQLTDLVAICPELCVWDPEVVSHGGLKGTTWGVELKEVREVARGLTLQGFVSQQDDLVLNTVLQRQTMQWSQSSTGAICSCFHLPCSEHVGSFCSDVAGAPIKSPLHWSSCDITQAWKSFSATSWVRHRLISVMFLRWTMAVQQKCWMWVSKLRACPSLHSNSLQPVTNPPWCWWLWHTDEAMVHRWSRTWSYHHHMRRVVSHQRHIYTKMWDPVPDFWQSHNGKLLERGVT